MIPKIGDIVYISEKFIKAFNRLPSGELYHDFLKQWIDNYHGMGLKVSNLSISVYDCFQVTFEIPDSNLILDKIGYLEGWKDQVPVAFFTYDRILEEAKSDIYCSCSSPKLKDVFISANIQYKFCQLCKKEWR